MTNQLENEVADLRKTAAVAADYEWLQGLITATTGGGLVVWALGSSTWGAIVMALGVAVWTGYYRQRFGRAVSRGSVVLTTTVILVGVVVCLSGWAVDQVMGLPVLVLPLLAALCLFATYRWGYRHVGVTWVHWAALALVALTSLARPVGLDVLGPGTGLFSLGVAMLVVGLVDHERLVRSMKPVPRD